MMQRWRRAAALLWAASMAAMAQDVTLKAEDGLALQGEWHPSDAGGGRAVLLLHMTVAEGRKTWAPLLPQLREAGFSVLAVDLRGFGATGGTADWDVAPHDVAAWIAWLKTQSGIKPGSIALVGASAGANLALQACAQSRQCPTVVALSPASNALFNAGMMKQFAGRSVALYAGRYDRNPNAAVRGFLKDDAGEVMVRILDSAGHGTDLLGGGTPFVGGEIRAWLERQLPR
ncbi:alpha/beta hydrolase [Chitiniphilus purpureus]|uniref:Alpha/beta hydrolase n=1 Tax=Chitiniphilus purpureus TaxID=2981137 RepID=A0ABY6DNQ8_9NEIS|nr:alpha/beta hydrolase [Chitiniphilus sp. CD1]UXY16015.1 alpha/beta hydrolase [Chitiniphilus sp. CD1]